MALRAARLVGAAAALALAIAGGCQILVDGDLGAVHCTEQGAVGPPACPAGFACSDGVCLEPVVGGRELGASCAEDAECVEGLFCLRPMRFGGDGAAICSRPCCTSSDCGEPEEGFVCWAPPVGGGSYCRRAASGGRAAGGADKVGEPCFVPDSCRSGLCTNGACADGCCTDTHCSTGDAVCRFGVGIVSQGASWACGDKPDPAGELMDPCLADADCRSGLCVAIGGELRCSIPCCDSAVCGSAIVATFPGVLACVDVDRGGSLVRACAAWLPESASGAVGAPCTDDLECRSGRCIDAAGGARMCSDVCCTDASCGDPSSYVCRPHELGTKWALRCEVK